MLPRPDAEPLIRMVYKVPDAHRLDIDMLDTTNFRAAEVSPDGTVVRTLTGRLVRGGIIATVDPDLTISEARLYDAVWSEFGPLIEAGRDNGERRIFLAENGAFPELFETLTPNQTIQCCVRQEVFKAWMAVSDSAMALGYDIVNVGDANGKQRFCAHVHESRI